MTRFIALASGKGGVGKTTTTLNLGMALTNLGKSVILVDANLGSPNLGLHLGMINPKKTLNHFLRKEKSLKEVTYKHECGLTIIPASSSYEEFQKTNPQKLAELFEHLDGLADFVLVDAPSGFNYDLLHILKNIDEVIVVTNPNITAVMEALKTVNLAKNQGNIVPGILLNMSHYFGRNEMKEKEVEEVLGHPIIANIRYDQKIKKALHRQTPIACLHPNAKSAKEFNKLAEFLCPSINEEKSGEK